jgi:hypothetical protein
MRFIYLLLALVALPALASLVGCSEESGTGGTGGVGGLSTEARLFVVQEYREDFGYVRLLEGVKICATDTDDCVWTNDVGRATVQVPIDREFSFTWEKEGYAPVLVADFEPQGLYLVQNIAMTSEERVAHLHDLVGSPYPMEGTGSVLVIPLDSQFVTTVTPCRGVAGRTFELSTAAGKPHYYDEEGNWDASLTATSCWGWGGFSEVPAGEVQVEIGGNAAEHCVPLYGWPGTVENSVRMPVRAGYWTQVYVDCEAPK